MGNIIEIRNVNKIYGSTVKTQVLHDISLDIEAGSFNAIIGESGSGKSTLLNILGSLDDPTDGYIRIDNRQISELSKKELALLRNETIGFVFQFHYLLPEFTAIENVLMPYKIKGKKVTGEIMARANELMEMVGLSDVKHNLANNMSGGQQQRTAIARALMNNPKIILADEPTGNLDSGSTEVIYELMRSVNKEMGTTFITITHDQRIADKADRIIEIVDGRVMESRRPALEAV
ncbi:MAG: ABC transporter ATP-binding protein [Vallitaleaceae bacterium]|jgi:lipoprotein-releasing system ATP-binding protein|nr:ABC transporter ATP-binding protein [Vallitaleaceae bacterium]